jgi:hypothetical protein
MTKHTIQFWHRHPFLKPWPLTSVEPTVAVPTSEGPPHNPLPSGVGSGAAGSSMPPPTVQLPAPTVTTGAGDGGGSPRQPHLDCSEASRISAGITWN